MSQFQSKDSYLLQPSWIPFFRPYVCVSLFPHASISHALGSVQGNQARGSALEILYDLHSQT